MIAGVGVHSVVFGLAGETALGKLVAGLSLALFKPFCVGDIVERNTPTKLKTATAEENS